MFRRLDEAAAKLGEIDDALMNPDVVTNPGRLREITKQRAHLVPIVETWQALEQCREELEEAREMLADPEMAEMAREEVSALEKQLPALESQLRKQLIPPDPYEGRDVILEIRAGTGGDEAALFAADLFRMYGRLADSHRWKIEVMSRSEITVGGASGKSGDGLKEIIAQISGPDAYNRMRHESGVHRVQRVPLTETQGRIHTSAATVALMPVPDAVEVNLDNADLRVDVYRASGPGGQSVNTTDSAVRITHIPSGLVVQCQDEKSQHKNKAKALKVLSARLLEKLEGEAHAVQAAERRAQVGSGDRSERIRTYNYPQNRVTDHRINLTLYQLDRIMAGALAPLIDALNEHLLEQQLKGVQD